MGTGEEGEPTAGRGGAAGGTGATPRVAAKDIRALNALVRKMNVEDSADEEQAEN